MDEIETRADELNGEDSGLLHPEGPEFHPPGARARAIQGANTKPYKSFDSIQCQCTYRPTAHIFARYFLKKSLRR